MNNSTITPSIPQSQLQAIYDDLKNGNLKYECNCTFYWLFVGNTCLTAAQDKLSEARKHTRQLQQLIEAAEDEQRKAIEDYTMIVDGLVQDVLKLENPMFTLSVFYATFIRTTEQTSDKPFSKTIAAALVAYHLGLVLLKEKPPIARPAKPEAQMQDTLKQLITTLSERPISYWVMPETITAAEAIIELFSNTQNL